MCETEHESFTPLVFLTSGGKKPGAGVFYKKLASMFATKYNKAYSKTLSWMRYRISFSFQALPTVGVGDIELALIEEQVGH